MGLRGCPAATQQRHEFLPDIGELFAKPLDMHARITDQDDRRDGFGCQTVHLATLKTEYVARQREVRNLAASVEHDLRQPYSAFDDLVEITGVFTIAEHGVAPCEIHDDADLALCGDLTEGFHRWCAHLGGADRLERLARSVSFPESRVQHRNGLSIDPYQLGKQHLRYVAC